MRRRSFLAAPIAALPLAAAAADDRIYAFGDGIPHTPDEYARLLADLTKSGNVQPDEYSRGGAVEVLEAQMASRLGKEIAVWLPTGTLANHLAVRLLATSGRRVLVQAESHLFNDCGDCAQTLSGLNLVPLSPGKATFTLEQVEQAASAAMLGRVETHIGAIQIETPVRRRRGERFDFGETQKISNWAREHKVGLHLDGARLFIESVYTGRGVKEYSALFDTVYVSMYKYFNAASGAILAGPKALLSDLYNTRRLFGGGLNQVWPFAAVALDYLGGFDKLLRPAVDNAERVIAELAKDGNFALERTPSGTNVFRLRVFGVNGPVYADRLEAAGISTRPPDGDWFTLQVNETWSRMPSAEIVRRFRSALG